MGSATNFADLVNQAKQNPLKWAVPEIVIEDGVHICHGAEESFKTMLTLQLHESLTLGVPFLARKPRKRIVTGMAELEMKERQFGHRLLKFFPNVVPDIRCFPECLRQEVLAAKTPKARIQFLADWAEVEGLSFISIDSAAKLFPPGFSPNEQEQASEVFNQIQRLPTVWILAHDRKPMAGFKAKQGNSEIVGSGRFAQDPDAVYQMVRPDGRSPLVYFHWGKMRAGAKPEPVPLYFDRIEYRLFPFHPYLHLLQRKAMLGTSLVDEAAARYGWQERAAREHLGTLSKLIAANGDSYVLQSFRGHAKVFEINKMLTVQEPLTAPSDLVQPCTNTGGIKRGASLLECCED